GQVSQHERRRCAALHGLRFDIRHARDERTTESPNDRLARAATSDPRGSPRAHPAPPSSAGDFRSAKHPRAVDSCQHSFAKVDITEPNVCSHNCPSQAEGCGLGYRPSRWTLKTSRTPSSFARTRESCSTLVTCSVAFTVAVLSGFACADNASSWTWFSLITAATSRRKPSRSHPSMRIATGYVRVVERSHSTSTKRSLSAV